MRTILAGIVRFTYKEGTTMPNGRQLAMTALVKLLKDKSYSNLAVNAFLKQNPLPEQERALFTTLVYGVLERKITLDYELSLYLKQPLKKLNPKVYVILLLGAYQILFLDHIPGHAAVNESVKLAKKNGASFASGLVNAVLRKVLTNGLVLPEDKSESYRWSIQYSCPEELIRLWVGSYGREAALDILGYLNEVPPMTIRVNTTLTTKEELTARLADEGISAEDHPLVPDALMLSHTGSIEKLESFREGLFHVQDASSQLCVARLDPRPGETVFDVCAAPGGKTFTMAERMEGTGTVFSYDLHEHRTELIRNGAERLHLSNVKACAADASVFDPERGLADKVLCDVPCSGLGIIGRKPEIRYKALDEIDNLPGLQYHILCISSQYCAPGGRLVYSTCSLNPEENEKVCEKFAEEHPDFKLLSQETILPGSNHCDGFFIAVLEHREANTEGNN